jgi:hypothetical protein
LHVNAKGETDFEGSNDVQMPISDTPCSSRQEPQAVVEDETSLLVWKKQELLKIFPNESSETIENALLQNDLTSAINYILDNHDHNEDNKGK